MKVQVFTATKEFIFDKIDVVNVGPNKELELSVGGILKAEFAPGEWKSWIRDHDENVEVYV